MSAAAPVLRCAGLGFSYAERVVLRGVELELHLGELTAVLGQNGVGKSTLLRLLAGLIPPTAGRVELDGQDLARVPRPQVAKHLALVTQESAGGGDFTVLELALLGRAPHQRGLGFDSPRDVDAARRALVDVGLTDLADRPVWSLSGGERRRASLARALAQEPRVLLLDEPTAFLDLAHQVRVLRRARDNARAGMCVVCVLHDPNLAVAHADRLLFVDPQGGVRSGPVREMFRADQLTALYQVEMVEARAEQLSHPIFVPASS